MENSCVDQAQLILNFLSNKRGTLKALYSATQDISRVRSFILEELKYSGYNIEQALVMLSDEQLTLALTIPIAQES